MSSIQITTSDPSGESLIADNDEVKIFGCEKHEEDVDIDGDDNSDRLSPVIKEEVRQKGVFFIFLKSSSLSFSHHHNKWVILLYILNKKYFVFSIQDRLNSEQQIHNFFPYFISPYYHAGNAIQSFVSLFSR
jgi:hypothetical protein